MASYDRPDTDRRGWTPWIKPRMAGYRLACCDCGLVHLIRFRVVPSKGGKAVQFKAARHVRATAAMRREKAKKLGKRGVN